jgi:hypothetical protein
MQLPLCIMHTITWEKHKLAAEKFYGFSEYFADASFHFDELIYDGICLFHVALYLIYL